MTDTVSPPPAAGKPADNNAAAPKSRPTAGPARIKRRHFFLIVSFLIWVVLPVIVSGFYLYRVADDQYASHVGFSVRKEESNSAIELLGGITELSGSSSSDTDILYEFIQSPQMVRIAHEKLDLFRIYRNPGDPVFGLGDDPRIEALVGYWNRVVKVFYDRSSGLIEVRVVAFNPNDAQDIANVLFEESSRMINELSAIARADAMSYAEEELNRAVARLKEVRQARTEFQNRTQIVDPQADIQGQMGVLNSLETQLANAKIELILLLDRSSDDNPRAEAAGKKIKAIEELIEAERDKFGGESKEAYSTLLAEYEALAVDLEFAQASYLSAQAARDAAFAEAQRKSRYLGTYMEPTLAETAEHPHRMILVLLIMGGAFVSWSVLAMVYYSLRDRR